MRIIITERLLEKYPGINFAAVIARDIDNKKTDAKLTEEKSMLEKELREKCKKPGEIGLIKEYNKFFNRFNKTVPLEYQINSILDNKQIPHENPVKDALFMVELKHACMLSAHDLKLISGDMMFDLSSGGESFLNMSDKEIIIKKDDILLKDKDRISTSLLFGPGSYDKLTDGTSSCIFIFWYLSKISDIEMESIMNDLNYYLNAAMKRDIKLEKVDIINEWNKKIIDPWGSTLIEDYTKLITDFHLDVFDTKLFPNPNRLMRRGVIFSGIDLKPIADAIKGRKPFYVLSGIMPSGKKIHLGNKMVVEMISYFQKMGGETYILIADLEAEATREITLEEARKRALEFHIPAYIALGLDPEKTTFYFQSENVDVMHAAYKYSKKVTLAQFQALYGSADPERIFSALTQVGDILYPQFKKRMPGIIPVGVDQCPHILLTRDIVNRMKSEKYYPPAAIFQKYTPALNGASKMSKSIPDSMIELPEDPKEVCRKIKRAMTGGRDTLEEHRKLGAVIEKDMVFELLKQHFIEDDAELEHIYREYKSGRMTSGELKELACKKMTEFMQDLENGIEKARKNVGSLKFIR